MEGLEIPKGLRFEPHEDWGMRLVVPDTWFYEKGSDNVSLRMGEFFAASRRLGFTSDNLVDINGQPTTDKDDSFPTNPANENESMLIRLRALSESINILSKDMHE